MAHRWCSRLSFGLAVWGLCTCNDPYPISATACDDWCLATQRAGCEEDWPERCVSDCEANAAGRVYPACEVPWLTLMRCYQAAPQHAFYCDEAQSRPKDICLLARSELATCIAPVVGACMQSCYRTRSACGESLSECELTCANLHVGCEAPALALFGCELEAPVQCGTGDGPAPLHMACEQHALQLLACAGWGAQDAGP